MEVNDVKSKVSIIMTSVMLSGIIMFIAGFYLSAVKGGIPYQDPTVKMQIEWRAYHLAGDCNMKIGGILLTCGVIGRFAGRRIK